MTTPLERLGTALSDRYAIERELGTGGMAAAPGGGRARRRRRPVGSSPKGS